MRLAGLLLRQLGDHGFRRDQETGDRSGILQRAAHDLGRVDHAFGDEVAVLECLGIVAKAVLAVLKDLTDDDRAVLAGILEDLPRRRLQSLAHDLNADLLVVVVRLQALERLACAQQCYAAARNDAPAASHGRSPRSSPRSAP